MTDHHDRKAHYLPRQRLALDLYARGKGADDMKFQYDYGGSPEWNAWENERVLKTIAKLETPCNFERWAKLDAWTMQQATCIIIGVEPDVVLGIVGLYWFRKDYGYVYEGDRHIFNECVLLTCKLDKIFLELRGSYLAGKLQIIGPWDEAKTLVAPSVLTNWATTKGYAISPALADIAIHTTPTPTPTTEPDHDQQVEEPDHNFKTIKDHVKYLLKENPSKGLAMRKIHSHWKLKKNEAAAYVLDRPAPDDEEERRRLNEQWRYHTGLLDQNE